LAVVTAAGRGDAAQAPMAAPAAAPAAITAAARAAPILVMAIFTLLPRASTLWRQPGTQGRAGD
jgi:hypothetical protein